MNSLNQVNEKQCAICGSAFGCGTAEKNGHCWCSEFPPIFTMDEGSDCLCPVCLKKKTIDKIEEYVQTITVENAIYNKAKDLPNTKPLEEIDYYIEKGYYIFTTWYHLKRGNCCENGCRHCPYGYNISNENA